MVHARVAWGTNCRMFQQLTDFGLIFAEWVSIRRLNEFARIGGGNN
jgi:hypothetical protein